MIRMRKGPTISLTDEHEKVSHDIRIYTESTLASLYERFEKQDIDDIAAEVVRKANAMFLWVWLVVDTLLEQQSIYDLQKTVQNLPSELTGVYVHMLKRLEAHKDESQKRRSVVSSVGSHWHGDLSRRGKYATLLFLGLPRKA